MWQCWVCVVLIFGVALSGCEKQVENAIVMPSVQTPDINIEPATSESQETSSPVVVEAAKPLALIYHNPLSKEEQAAGWISLFDGHTLFGWTSANADVNWRVENGVITADAGPVGLLVTDVPFANYELVCEYKLAQGANSGLFLRTTADPKDVKQECYEVNIADVQAEGYLTGSLVGRQKTETPIQGSGDWNLLQMTADGNHFVVKHNGEQVLEYTDETGAAKASGLIGLQKNAGKIEFRKVILKPLGLTSLFNGKDLSGWREVPGSKSVFTVEDETIHVVNGQGFYETEETFQDFIFQAQSISNAKELNSGYFFRAIAGTAEAPSHGYEVQIHNGFINDDRTQPNNAGTGAIFRRIDARYVVSNDNEWFTTTLIAHGPQISVWINGYQVVDWIDDRQPDENPRKGLRLEGGHISLQGHDPTTDLHFRNINILELPK